MCSTYSIDFGIRIGNVNAKYAAFVDNFLDLIAVLANNLAGQTAWNFHFAITKLQQITCLVDGLGRLCINLKTRS